MRPLYLSLILILAPLTGHTADNDDAVAACADAFKSLIKIDKSYSNMQRVSCNSAMEHSKAYWVCVKKKVDAGEDPKRTAQNCPE